LKYKITLLTLLIATPALAAEAPPPPPPAPTTFTLVLSEVELVKVANALKVQPYQDVAELLSKIQDQVNAQIKPKDTLKPEDKISAPADAPVKP